MGAYLDLLASRQRVVASNVANVDTPDYKTMEIDFQREFQTAVDSQSRANNSSTAAPVVIEAQGLLTKNDGNNVNLDREARLLAENSIRFNLASTMMRREVKMIRNAIQEGKGGL